MAANLKIGIIADDGNAQKKFEGLSTSVDMTAKSVTQLANQFAKLNAAKVNILNKPEKYVEDIEKLNSITKLMTTTFNQLMNAVERQKISWGVAKDSAASLKKELAELEKVETLLISKGVGSSFSAELAGLQPLIDKYEEYKKELKDIIKLKEEEEKLAAQKLTPSSILSGVQGTTEYKKNGLLGDNLSQMKQEYEAYSEALTKIINTLGAGSPEAERMASAMNELNKKIKDCSTQTTATTKRIGNLIKNFVSAQMIVWAIRKAFTSITTTLKEASEAASEAEETYNLFITTFENASIAAEQAASRLSNALGIANSTAQETLGTFGDLAAGYGATDKEALEFAETATEVAMDIVSYKNISGDLSTTMQSLSSGLAGNVENFRKLGYVMTQAEVKTKLQKKGLDKLTGSALQYAQIQARLEILQEKSVKAQGDMIKTLDSTENVTRRLNESWLEWKENLGSTVNVVLTPMKRWLNEILTISNKVTSAMKEINGGEFTVKVEQVATGEQLEKIVKNLFAKSNGSGSDFWRRVEEAVLGVSATDVSNVTGKEASDVALAVGTDIEKVIKIIDESSYFISEEEKKNARAIYQQEKADAEKRQKKEDAKNEAISAIQSAMSFIDNLNSINGVYGDDSILSRRLEKTQNDVTNNTSLGDNIEFVVDNLLKNLSSASASSFVSALDIALGREDTESMLEAKLASVEEVYEALWNEFYSSGEELTEWQKSALEKTLELAKSLNGQIEDLNEEKTVKKKEIAGEEAYPIYSLGQNVSSAITAAYSVMSGSKAYSLQNLLESVVESINDVLENGLIVYDTVDTFLNRMKSRIERSLEIYSSPTASDFNSSDPYSFLTDIQKATGENTYLDALEAQLSAAEEYYENVKTFYKADGVISEEEQTALNDILAMVTGIYEKKEEEANKEEPEPEPKAWEEYWQQIVDTVTEIYNFTKDSLRVLFEAPVMGAVKFVQGGVSGVKESKDNGEGILGNIWGFIKGSFSSVWDYIKQLFSDLLEPLVKFITESDAFQELMTVLSDSVLPAINAALEPFLPLLKMFAYFLQNVVLPILYELFPVIKAIAVVCGYVMALIGAAITFVSDGVKWLVGNLVGWIEDMVNAIAGLWGGHVDWGFDGWRNIDVWGNTTKVWKDMCGYVEEIKDCTMEIKDNTSEDEMDLTVLNDLFSAGILSRDEMNALRASYLGQADPGKQTQLLASTAGDYATYLRSGGTSNVSYGDVSIEINSESGDPEKIAKEVARVLEEWQRNGKKSFSVAIA